MTTTLSGSLVNGLSDSKTSLLRVSLYKTLPTSWGEVSKGSTLQNNQTGFSFDTTNNYLAIALLPSGTDLVGSAIVFDIQTLLSTYGSSDQESGYHSNLLLTLCDSFDGSKFTLFNDATSRTVSVGDNILPQNFYFTLANFSLKSIADPAQGVFPYIIGKSDGTNVYGAADKNNKLMITKIADGVIVKRKHSVSMLLIILLIVVFIIVIIAIVFGYKHYKKKKPTGM